MSRSKRNKYETLYSLRIVCDFKFDPIKAYLENTQRMILQHEKELNEKYHAWNKKHVNNPEFPDAFDVYEMDYMNSLEFSTILNQSIYLTIYSSFEIEFFNLCKWCQKIENFKIGPKDIKGQNYILQCRNYITKVLDVNLDSLNEEWIEIRKCQFIRNSIAHNNGILKSPQNDVLKFIEESRGISFDAEKSSIKIESIDFLKTLIDKLTNFLSGTAEKIISEKNKTNI